MIVMLALMLHLCGQGPVVIDVTRPLTVPPSLPCVVDSNCTIEQPKIEWPTLYRWLCPCQEKGYGTWTAYTELWTDWPIECNGHQ